MAFAPMSYQVLARKYRPQKFSEVIGQEHVTRTLKNAIEQQRTAHGYIFSGRSEEHTSELQSRFDLVCRLLLEKKKKKKKNTSMKYIYNSNRSSIHTTSINL